MRIKRITKVKYLGCIVDENVLSDANFEYQKRLVITFNHSIKRIKSEYYKHEQIIIIIITSNRSGVLRENPGGIHAYPPSSLNMAKMVCVY